MKIRKCHLLTSIVILLTSTGLCVAQRVADTDDNRQIVAQSTFLPYKTVIDNFGKKFAQSFFVIQVDIRNEKLNKQFIVQTIDVLIDPNQCRFAKELDPTFNTDECQTIFNTNFYSIQSQQSTRREEIIGTGKADLNRSNRNVGFRALAFTANMGTILTGFKGLIGRDGILGINVLGTTATAAANALFPNTADDKLQNLQNALPTEDVIIRSKESKTFNIFIPTERIFWETSWKRFIKPARDSDFETYKFKLVLDMILLSTATGVLVDNDAPTVAVRSDDSLRRQAEKFRLIAESTNQEIEKAEKFRATVELIQKNLASANDAVKNMAKTRLQGIVVELNKETQFQTFLTTGGRTITPTSDGAPILQAIKDLMRNLNDEVSENKVMDIVIMKGN